MSNNTGVIGRRIVAAIVGIAGLLSIIAVPDMGMRVVNLVTKNASMVIEMFNRPNLIAAPKLVSFWYPFWSGLSVVAGAVLLLMILPLVKGDKWARPMTLGALLVPTIFGIYALWPITFFSRIMFGEIAFGQVSFFAKELISFPAMIFLIGIIPFFILLLFEKSSFKNKLIQFFVFLLLILTVALSFLNAHTAFRMLWSNVISKPQIIDKALAVGSVVNLAAVIVLMVGIPLLASGRYKGLFLSLLGSLTAIMGNGTLLVGYWDIWDYRIGIIFAIMGCLFLLVPGIKTNLVEESISMSSNISKGAKANT